MRNRILAALAVLLLFATHANAQLRCELGGTNTTANVCTDNTFIVGDGTSYVEETPSGTCDASSSLRFNSGAADGSRLSCFAGGGAAEWADISTILSPADSSGAQDVVIGGTTLANSDILLQGSTSPGTAVFNDQNLAVGVFRVESGDAANTSAIEVDYATDQLNLFEAIPDASDTVTIGNDVSRTVGGTLSGAFLNVTPVLTEAGASNHGSLNGVEIQALTTTVGAATVTDSATLYIAGAPDTVVSGVAAALRVDAGNVVFDEDLTVSGGDLFWATNTAGHLLINNGTSFQNVAVSGDITITSGGVTSQDFLVINEDLTFDFDGIDTVSTTLANTVSGSSPNHNIDVFFSGYLLEQVSAAPAADEFTLATNQVTLGLAPDAADTGHVTATYIY